MSIQEGLCSREGVSVRGNMVFVEPSVSHPFIVGSLTSLGVFQGNVYVKCPTIPAAMAAVNALHGRYFGGKTSVT